MRKLSRKILSSVLSVAMLLSMCSGAFAAGPGDAGAEPTGTASPVQVEEVSYPRVTEDTENKEAYASGETELAQQFGWYKWEFEIDPELDTVGTVGDGVGLLYFRLYVPETVPGEKYPIVEVLGVLGATNTINESMQATNYGTLIYASEVNQAVNPSYVLCFNTPYEACVNYEAELAYMYQYGEVAKWVAETYGNVDMDRIYATGRSQGAGWSYELASVQPDLLAAILIQAGTTVHTSWGDQCDMQAIADSDVNVYIWHGYVDTFIPVNEAYRAYQTLTDLGKKNVVLKVENAGHGTRSFYSETEITEYVQWLYAQRKGVPFTDTPEIIADDNYENYKWAGVQVLSSVEGWATAIDYANVITPYDNPTWNQVVAQSNALAEGAGGTGKTWLSKIRIGDETATSYDDATKEEPTVTITAGDTVAVTVQGYTGGYGDDWDAFNEEWDVEWAVLEGSATDIELTCEASAEPILRPATVTLANGGGPNVNNSLYNENTLDGKQVYIKIDTAEDFQGDTLKVALRFIRDLGEGEYASYWHVVQLNVESKPVQDDSGSGSGSSSRTYAVSLPSGVTGGSVESSASRAQAGRTVTLTVTPDEGYELDGLTVTDSKGNELKLTDKGSGRYAFTMPSSAVDVAVTFLPVSIPAPELPFTDVTQGQWYYEAVQYVYEQGLMAGTGGSAFQPDTTTTRGMIVTILHNLEGKPGSGGSPFTDVASSAWYAGAVAWASEKGIVSGYGGGLFGPDDIITREQMAVILYHYAQYKGYDTSARAELSGFTDRAQISAYALEAMQWANAQGLINGMGDGTLAPQGGATRAQVASILKNFCENVAK